MPRDAGAPHASPESDLTDREAEVLALVGDGLSNREIAHLLGIKRGTVRFHLREIHEKLGTEGDRDTLLSFGNGRRSGIFTWLAPVGSVYVPDDDTVRPYR